MITSLIAATLASATPADALAYHCVFTEACIDQRPCFDSTLEVAVKPVDGYSDRVIIEMEGRRRLAGVTREGVWLSLRTWPDIDVNYRGEVLDIAETGLATLVVSSPGTAVEMISRNGTCQKLEGDQ